MSNKYRVYFMKPVGRDGPVKIGCSILPDRRLEEIAVWSPFPLELIGSIPGTMTDEIFLHNCFFDTHSHREWFHSSPKLRETIKTILESGTIESVRSHLKIKGSIRKGNNKAWTEDRRERASYGHRIRWVLKRLRQDGDEEIIYFQTPKSIDGIMSRWEGRPFHGVPGIPPTEEEFGIIDAFLAAPAEQVIENRIRKIKRSVVA